MSFSETIFLFLLALLVFGPKKLPEIGRQIGKLLNEFRRASNEFRLQIEAEISQAEMKDRQILSPTEAPSGVIATLPLSPEPAPFEVLPPVDTERNALAMPGSFAESASHIERDDSEPLPSNPPDQAGREIPIESITNKASHV